MGSTWLETLFTLYPMKHGWDPDTDIEKTAAHFRRRAEERRRALGEKIRRGGASAGTGDRLCRGLPGGSASHHLGLGSKARVLLGNLGHRSVCSRHSSNTIENESSPGGRWFMKSLETLSRLPELLGEIEGFKPAAERLLGAVDQLTSSDIPALGRTTTTAAETGWNT